MSYIPFPTFGYMDADIPFYGAVIGDPPLVQKLAVRLCFACRYAAVPHTGDHGVLKEIW